LLHRIKGVRRTAVMLVAAGAALLVFASAGSAGSPKISNGNFETGGFAPWSWDCLSSICNGIWAVSDKKLTPINALSWFGPMEKEYEAVSDFGLSDSVALYQRISLGSKKSTVKFDLEWNNRAGVWCNPGDLDPTDGCVYPTYNEQIRVFIQDYGDDPLTDPAVMTLFQSDNSTPLKQHKKRFSIKLPGLSGDYQLVFVAVAGDDVLNVGVDEVSINNGG